MMSPRTRYGLVFPHSCDSALNESDIMIAESGEFWILEAVKGWSDVEAFAFEIDGKQKLFSSWVLHVRISMI